MMSLGNEGDEGSFNPAQAPRRAQPKHPSAMALGRIAIALQLIVCA
jgi:hypothetical protein